MMAFLKKPLRDAADERGAVLVITALAMTALLAAAAYAIDVSYWYVHHSHLQTQADAAALAAGQDFQYPCTPGGAVDQAISTRVHQYDGTTAPTAANPNNPQVPTPPTLLPSSYNNPQTSAYGPAPAHNLFSVINRPDYFNQPSKPGDTDLSGTDTSDGSPCTDGKIDVKLSETNLPSLLPFVSPSYINAQARITLEKLTSGGGAEPFIEPLPAPPPSAVSATLVDESNADAPIASVPLTTDPKGDHTTWTGTNASVTFTDPNKAGTINVGLRVGVTTNGTTTYENNGANEGVTFTRVWTNSGTPGQPAASSPVPPQADDVTITNNFAPPPGSTVCPVSPSGVFSNFVAPFSSCVVEVVASNVQFASGAGAPTIDCTDASLSVTIAGGATVSFPCPSGTPLNGQTWTSNPVTVPPASNNQLLTVKWGLTAGNRPVGGTGGDNSNPPVCKSNKSCTGTLAVQRINSGALDPASAGTSQSGPIVGAAVTDTASGNEIMSVARGATKSVSVTINILGFQNSSTIPSAPIALTFGGTQANAALECGGSEGSPQFQQAVAMGCPTQYQTTTGSCPNNDNPPSCATENPGNGKLGSDLDPGMTARVYCGGVTNGCNPTCANVSSDLYNHWAAPNTINDLKAESPADPRLITLLVTDNGGLGNGANQNGVPIRTFADFYVTGWAGDPCLSLADGKSANGLAYTHDDDPGSANTGVLIGHFVEYTSTLPTASGTGQCTQNTFGNCVAVLTK